MGSRDWQDLGIGTRIKISPGSRDRNLWWELTGVLGDGLRRSTGKTGDEFRPRPNRQSGATFCTKLTAAF